MTRIRTQGYESENLKFTYQVNVDKEGNFTTTLPEDVVSKMRKVGMSLGHNRLYNEGYFSALSLEELNKQVKESVDKFSKKELIEEKVILKYSIDTVCTYCKTKDGKIVPNGYWATEIDGEYNWTNGTKEVHATSSRPFGFNCYVEPIKIKVWKFPDGEIKKEYLHTNNRDFDYDETLNWLDSICGIAPDGDYKEIDYTPEIGLFFKNLLVYIFNINEKIQKIFGKDVDLSKIDLTKIKQIGFGNNIK